jgi:Icc-related predicted phosphoesterase
VSEWFFTSDLHGQFSLYEQVAALAAERRPASIIIGGDLCPHAADAAGPARQRVFMQGFLVEFARRIRDDSPGTRLLLMMGNDDWAANVDVLEAGDGPLWHYLHERSVEVDGVPVAGISWVPITPFGIKDWERWDDGADEAPVRLDGYVSRDGTPREHRFDPARRSPTIAEALEALAALVDPARAILVSHSPPRGTSCDMIHSGAHVGSRALRRWIETHQPPAVFSGHIHESPRVASSVRDTLDRTVIVNPGQFGAALLSGVWFDPADVAGSLRHHTDAPG